MKRWISLLLTLAMLASVLMVPGAAFAEATTVSFSTDAVFLAVGKAVNIKASAKPYAATKKGVTYKTSDESIATVNTKGKLTGVAIGECQLTATSVYDTAVSASIPVKVIVPVQKVTLTADSNTVFVGKTLQLTASCTPTDATLQTYTYATSNAAVASVDNDGLVTGFKRGKATITAYSADGLAKTTFAVVVTQAPQSVSISPESVAAAAGKKVQAKATVLPADTDDKTVTWSTGDAGVATVNAKGQVTIVSVGQTQLTVTSNADASITANVPVQGLELAQSVAFDSSNYAVIINETTQLYTTVSPESTTDKTVTYQVKNKKIASVDENGVVTGLKGGKTTVYAYTADGSKKRAAATIEVIVPVTGVSYKYKDVRVGAGYRGSFTAEIQPSGATNKAMTWVSSDESIATVTGTNNRFTVKGRSWGRCKVTGTTEDGGFTVDVYVDVGSLRHAVSIVSLKIKNGKPYMTLKNLSDMNISQVRFELLGYDDSLQPIVMSKQGDNYVLLGSYNEPLAQGESTSHGQFTFYRPSDYSGLSVLQLAITGWTTDTGYYDHNGKLQYNYNIGESSWEWVTYPTDANPLAK